MKKLNEKEKSLFMIDYEILEQSKVKENPVMNEIDEMEIGDISFMYRFEWGSNISPEMALKLRYREATYRHKGKAKPTRKFIVMSAFSKADRENGFGWLIFRVPLESSISSEDVV